MVDELNAIETIVLENLVHPLPNEPYDCVLLERLRQRGYVLKTTTGWALTGAGRLAVSRFVRRADRVVVRH